MVRNWNVQATNSHENTFLVLLKLHAGGRRSNNVSTIHFWNCVIHLEHHENTDWPDEKIIIGIVGNEKEKTKDANQQANRLEGKRDGCVQHAFVF